MLLEAYSKNLISKVGTINGRAEVDDDVSKNQMDEPTDHPPSYSISQKKNV